MRVPIFISTASTLAVPAGSTPERNLRPRQAVEYFVDGSIAARGKHGIRPSLHALARNRSRGLRAGRRDGVDFVTASLQRGDGTL